MAINKNALIRYRTIDKCLQNKYRTWTLDDLIEACSDALYEYEGRQVNVSKRTIQLDIQTMRSDKLGYSAPIVVYDKKFYKYDDDNFSITDIPLNESDMQILSESVDMLKQFRDFSLFSELGGIIQRLEDKIYTEKTQRTPIIHLDKNENLKGLEYLEILYQAIAKKICLNIEYQSFKAREANVISFVPLLLKEYNNRWFVVGRKMGQEQILTLALDRIIGTEYNLNDEYPDDSLDGEEYYKNTIGATVLDKRHIKKVVLKVHALNAPYVLTKPFHQSQKVLQVFDDKSILIQIEVHINFELERLILGYGHLIEVLAPEKFRNRIRYILDKALEQYRPTGD